VLQVRRFRPGECVTWHDNGAAELEVQRVDCSEPHLMEMIGVTKRVTDRKFPTDARWQQLVEQFCGPPIVKYLQHPIDPQGRYYATGILPLASAWVDGDHNIQCAIGPATTTLTTRDQLVGKVDANDQSLVWATGVCIGNTPSNGMIRVDCATPHFAEATATVDLAGRFDHAPSVQETFDSVGDECRGAADGYLGRPLDEGLSVSVLSRVPESWAAGSTKVTCIITRFENGQPADLPGPLR
jgi:hypothetical protein